jgi:hypothetical protein
MTGNKGLMQGFPGGIRALPWAVLMLAFQTGAQAENFEITTSLFDTATSKAVAAQRKSGELSTFFESQKEMTYGILKEMGIPLESLPADVRQNLAKFHTRNFEAFKLFSMGLNAQDEGKFADAKAFFKKALELDPKFELAGELSVAMPASNAASAAQLKVLLASSAKSASTSGKTLVQLDLATAVAALQAGIEVVVADKPSSATNSSLESEGYSSTKGGATRFADANAVAVVYQQNGVNLANSNEWLLDQTASDANGLARVGDSNTFYASRNNAVGAISGSTTLGDGSEVTWGTWNKSGSNSYSVISGGNQVPTADLGPEFKYLIGKATREMPTTGTATFVPAGGFLNNASGTISVDFTSRNVQLNSLGFDLSGKSFSGLTGGASYLPSVGSGFFSGNYSGGTCVGCTGFAPTASSFSGNFLGEGAAGLLYSTILQTGNGTVSGAHAFKR